MIGNWKKRKNIDKLIEAIDSLVNNNYNIELRLHFAFWYDNKYRDIFLDLIKNKKNVYYTEGVLSSINKYNFIKNCDLIISCSSGEGWSLPPREAIAIKVPVLVTDVMGHGDLINSDYVNIININKNNFENGDYQEENFKGKMNIIEVSNIISGIKHCYENYSECIEKSVNAYYYFYEKSKIQNFEFNINKFLKTTLVFNKSIKNKKTLLYFPHCFYPPTDGCHTVVMEQIEIMTKKGFEVHIYTIKKLN